MRVRIEKKRSENNHLCSHTRSHTHSHSHSHSRFHSRSQSHSQSHSRSHSRSDFSVGVRVSIEKKRSESNHSCSHTRSHSHSFLSGATRNRTGDTWIFSPLLYRLSYGTSFRFANLKPYFEFTITTPSEKFLFGMSFGSCSFGTANIYLNSD